MTRRIKKMQGKSFMFCKQSYRLFDLRSSERHLTTQFGSFRTLNPTQNIELVPLHSRLDLLKPYIEILTKEWPNGKFERDVKFSLRLIGSAMFGAIFNLVRVSYVP